MSTKIASVYAEISGDNTKLNAALTDSKTKLTGFGGALSNGMGMLKNFAITAIASGVALKVLSDGFDTTVNRQIALAASTRSLSRLTGDSAENTSKLIEATGDLKINYSTLTTAMEAATRKGVDVSITGLERLSTKYLSLNSGLERSEFLMKTFGRSGADMGALMEKGAAGIQSAMDAIQGGQVITQEAMIAARQYEMQIESLNDAWEGFALTIGQKAVPYLNALLKSSTEMEARRPSMFRNIIQETQAENDLNIQLQIAAENYKRTSNSAQYYQYILGRQITTSVALSQSMATTNDYFDRARIKSYQTSQAMVKYQSALLSVKEAQDNLKDIQKNWLEKEGGDIVQMLGTWMPASSKKSKTALGEIDEVFGTTYLATELNNEAMTKLVDQYGRTGDIKAFTAGLEALKATMPQTSTELDKATLAADGFKTAIAGILAMDGAVLRATFSATISGGGKTGNTTPGVTPKIQGGQFITNPKTNTTIPGSLHGEAFGGSFIIPPGYSENFHLGAGHTASSGERVTVSPIGKEGGANNNFYAPINIYPKSGDGLADIMRGLSQ